MLSSLLLASLLPLSIASSPVIEYDCKWTPNGFPEESYYGIDMSSNGRVQGAASYERAFYISHDYGQTTEYVNGSHLDVAISGTGRYITATGERVLTSQDSGESWNLAPIDGGTWSTSMSKNGRYQLISAAWFAESNDNDFDIYTSCNWGANWTRHEMFEEFDVSIGSAMSAGGKRQIVARSTLNSPLSIDYGKTFHPYNFTGLQESQIASIAYSDTAKYQVVGTLSELAVSNDHGQSWRVVLNSTEAEGNYQPFYGSALSFNGEYQLASNLTHYFVSSDYGDNWATHVGPPDSSFLTWIKMDEDAHIAMLTDTYGGKIYAGDCGWTATYYTEYVMPVVAEVYVSANLID